MKPKVAIKGKYISSMVSDSFKGTGIAYKTERTDELCLELTPYSFKRMKLLRISNTLVTAVIWLTSERLQCLCEEYSNNSLAVIVLKSKECDGVFEVAISQLLAFIAEYCPDEVYSDEQGFVFKGIHV